jgi:hypothetical protein
MLRLLKHFPPSLPPVAVLLEPPLLTALRVASPRKVLEPLVEHEELLPMPSDGLWPSPEEAGRLAESLLVRLGQPKRLSLILGDPFFRMQVLTLEDFPRQEAERHQVILWHIRKVLNLPLDAVRLRYEVLQKTPGAVTLWLTLCPEEGARDLEQAFSARGCHLGYVGASSVELYNLGRAKDVVAPEGSCLLINRTTGYLSFLFTDNGRPVFFRCKETRGMEGDEADVSRLQQEIRLTLAYHHEKINSAKLSRIVVRKCPDGVALPVEEVVEEGTLVQDWKSVLPALPGGQPHDPERLPLYGLWEGK